LPSWFILSSIFDILSDMYCFSYIVECVGLRQSKIASCMHA
jgi:hypothetical protein